MVSADLGSGGAQKSWSRRWA